ncbi:SRPBCC domain-containing protein [Streptomyces sp. NPDC002004]
MEHEVFVPVPVESLRRALADPVRVARAVPGFQQDTVESPGAGRFKVRVGGSSITYRGALRISAAGDDRFSVEGDGTEVRGGGSVKLALSLSLDPVEGGTVLRFSGGGSGDGRVAELPSDALRSASERLLDRFGEALALESGDAPLPTGSAPADRLPEARTDDDSGADGAGTDTERDASTGGAEEPTAEEPTAEEPSAGQPEPSVFDVDVPPSSLDPFAGDVSPDGEDVVAPPAEAAHARRTMIGRSAEEVDHAPPRGRYAPVPAPETASPTATLRWAAPAAALLVASAIVVTRALRRRTR